MSGETIAMYVLCGLIVVQQIIHVHQMKQWQNYATMLSKLLASRNYTDYSVGEARQAKAAQPPQPEKGYGSAFTDE